MKIKGVVKDLEHYFSKTVAEIEILPEELARQLTLEQIDYLECYKRMETMHTQYSQPKPTCEHEWKFYSMSCGNMDNYNYYTYQCAKCGKFKIERAIKEPEPKPTQECKLSKEELIKQFNFLGFDCVEHTGRIHIFGYNEPTGILYDSQSTEQKDEKVNYDCNCVNCTNTKEHHCFCCARDWDKTEPKPTCEHEIRFGDICKTCGKETIVCRCKPKPERIELLDLLKSCTPKMDRDNMLFTIETKINEIINHLSKQD